MAGRTISSSPWLVAGVLAVGTTLMFRVEPISIAITIVLGILAVLGGLALFRGSDARVSRWSTVLGIAWLACFAALAIIVG